MLKKKVPAIRRSFGLRSDFEPEPDIGIMKLKNGYLVGVVEAEVTEEPDMDGMFQVPIETNNMYCFSTLDEVFAKIREALEE